MTDFENPSTPTIQKKSANPPGILPRNAQVWFIGGISVVMVLVIALTGGKDSKNRSTTGKTLASQAQDPNEARIQEYRVRIEQQARKLAEEQAKLTQAKETLGLTPDSATPSARAYGAPASPPPLVYDRPAVREESWIETDKERREYQSLFESNVALSYRDEPKTEKGTNVAREAPQPGNEHPQPHVSEETPSAKVAKPDSQLNRAGGKQYQLFEGTVIETVLTNRLDGSFSGPVNTMVTTNVYSHDRQHLLIPQGTRILGEVKRVETFSQQRLAATFHRLIMPDGYSVSLDQFHGLNQIGETGLTDLVNHHYVQVFGVSLAIGAIAGFSQANTRGGTDASAEDVYRQGVGASLSQSSLRILDRYLNVLPTFTIREGHRIKVYLAGDLLLPAYENHQMPGDL